MSKFLGLLLFIIFICNYLYCDVYAKDNAIEYSQQYDWETYYKDIYNNYENLVNNFTWNYLKTDENNAYVGFINQTNSIMPLIESSSWFIGRPLDENEYIEILINLMATMEAGSSDIFERQVEADSIKGIDDYASDVIDFTLGGISPDSKIFDSISKETKKHLELILTTAEESKIIEDFTISNLEEYEKYQKTIKQYGLYRNFLDIIITNAEDDKLINAASTLKMYTNKVLCVKLGYINGIKDNLGEKIGWDILFDQVTLDIVSEQFQLSDLSVVNFLGQIAKNWPLGQSTFQFGIFVGDTVFGTSNIFIRHNEMYVMKHIRDALICDIENKIKLITSGTNIQEIEDLCNELRYLLYVNSRGEYCMYSMLANDKRLAELVTVGDKKNYSEWYNTANEINTSIFTQIDNVIPKLDNYIMDNDLTELSTVDISHFLSHFWNIEYDQENPDWESLIYNFLLSEIEWNIIEHDKSNMYDIVAQEYFDEITLFYLGRTLPRENIGNIIYKDGRYFIPIIDMGYLPVPYIIADTVKSINNKEYDISIIRFDVWDEIYTTNGEYKYNPTDDKNIYYSYTKKDIDNDQFCEVLYTGKAVVAIEDNRYILKSLNYDSEILYGDLYGEWDNYDSAENIASMLSLSFIEDDQSNLVKATISGRIHSEGTFETRNDNTFNSTLSAYEYYNVETGQWESTDHWDSSKKNMYIQGEFVNEKQIECEIKYEGDEHTYKYSLYRTYT